MRHSLVSHALAALLLLTSAAAWAADAPATQAVQQYVYVLKLVPRLHDDKAWTAADQASVQKHFMRLKEATDRGEVIFAGRTNEPGDKTFGLVVFEATDEAAARAFMEADDAVKSGVMTATLHPYLLVLQRKSG